MPLRSVLRFHQQDKFGAVMSLRLGIHLLIQNDLLVEISYFNEPVVQDEVSSCFIKRWAGQCLMIGQRTEATSVKITSGKCD